MTAELPVLVIGASGAQGGAVLKALADRGVPTRALVRDARDAGGLHDLADEIVMADLSDIDAVARAVERSRAVFLVTPFEADRDAALETAARVAAGLARGRARHVVFNTGIIAGMPDAGVGSIDGKHALLAALRGAEVPVVELAVTYYLENWLMPWASGHLAAGILSYTLPADLPVSWLAQRDMAAAAAAALLRPDLAGKTIQLGGETRTPQEIAALVAKATRRSLRFEQLGLGDFVAATDAASGPARLGTAIGALYRWVIEKRPAAAKVGAGGLAELGVEPISPARWVAAQSWRSADTAPA